MVLDFRVRYRARMILRLSWLFLCLLLGCGRSITAKKLNEPCTRPSQCEAGLTCLAGVCVAMPDAGPDGGGDGGA
jgi:hypothetical protein